MEIELTEELNKQFKKLIHEFLDERELEKKMNGPYDFPDDLL